MHNFWSYSTSLWRNGKSQTALRLYVKLSKHFLYQLLAGWPKEIYKTWPKKMDLHYFFSYRFAGNWDNKRLRPTYVMYSYRALPDLILTITSRVSKRISCISELKLTVEQQCKQNITYFYCLSSDSRVLNATAHAQSQIVH